jgi:hypothetical protein
MFRKIRSNRDPRDTVFTELKREIGPHFAGVKTRLTASANNHSTFLFWMMVINISLSAILSFTVFRNREPPPKQAIRIAAPVSDGFSQVMQASQAIGEMLRLKKAIDSLSSGKQLTAKDSLTLEKALDRFQQLNKQFNPKR